METQIDFAEKLRASVALAVDNAKLFGELKRSRDELEKRVRQRTRELDERVKELDCLCTISRLASSPEVSLENMLRRAVETIPAGWQHPEIAAARITVEGQPYQTENFQETPWKLSSDILRDSEPIGFVEACYLEERLLPDGGLFLKEEKDLIRTIADQLGESIGYRTAREAMEAEFAFRKAIESSMLSGIIVVDREGRQSYVNAAFCRLVGWSEQELLGQKPPFVYWPPEEVGHMMESFQDVLSGRSSDAVEVRFQRRNGERFQALVLSSPLKDAQENPVGWIASVTDITDRKRAEQEIHRLNAELEQRVLQRTAQLQAANEELESFSYSVSHDLRSPLLAIDGFSKILDRRYGTLLDAEGQRILKVIRESTSRMGQLIDDLLSFSRWGRQEMRTSPIDMKELAQEVFSQLLSHRPVTFRIHPLPPIRADHAMIRQVLFNLLSNALKFTASQPEPVIEVGGASGPSENTYFVRDNGVGFDPRYADRLFAVFHRLHRTEEFSGSGVGLAIVKRIVSGHGGRVWAEGAPQQGATFYFSLPRGEGAWRRKDA
jgi:PAS domain S-box-containing protein